MSRMQRYRGRGRKRRLRGLIVVPIVLLVLTGVSFWIIQNYLVYGADGSVRLSVPGCDAWREEPSASPSGIDIIFDAPSDAPSAVPISPPPSLNPAAEPLRALFLPLDALTDNALLDTTLALGADTRVDAIVLEVKAADGRLAFHTATPMAQGANLTPADNTLPALIERIRTAGFKVVARVVCFEDNALPLIPQVALGLKVASGVNWWDYQKHRWVNPYKEEVTAYLFSLLSDLAALSWDEIILDRIQFPTQGGISYIDYSAHAGTPRYDAIEQFARHAAEIVSPSGITLSCALLSETGQTGESLVGGQRLSALADIFDRLYAPVDEQTLEPVRTGVASVLDEGDLPTRFVPIFSIPDGAGPDLLETTVGALTEGGWLLENAGGAYAGLWP